MAQQAIIVYISQEGSEVSDLQDLVDGSEVELDWVGSLNGADVPIKVRLSDIDPEDEDPNEARLSTPLQRERYHALLDGGIDADIAFRDARKW